MADNYHNEWLVRKGRRTVKQAQHADVYRRLQFEGYDYEIRRAYRSAGYQSNYTAVPKYFIIVRKDGEITNGFTMTEKVFQEAEIRMNKTLAIVK